MAVSRAAIWFRAFRLHTLPLAFAGIALGNFLACDKESFDPLIAGLTLLTAICLQILSNLANDYGDTKHGADNNTRIGPLRVTQTGAVTHMQIKTAILIFIFLCLTSGSLLLILSTENVGVTGAITLFIIGLLAIAAAIAYTATKKPYGYKGYGDLSVFVFFGLVGVYGSFYLQTGELPIDILLPAAAMGLLCSGVLNVNNIRDIEADLKANKRTLALKLGLRNAKIYHWALLLSALFLFSLYYIQDKSSCHLLWFLLPGILFIINAAGVSASETPSQINPFLKQLVISILVFTIVYGTGLVLF